jgi:ribosomal protein S18 acetylase RimI-like enzyme
MAAHRTPPEPPPHEVVEVEEPAQRELRARFLRGYSPTMADEVVAQLVEQKARLVETIGARYFVGRAGGEDGSIAELYVAEGVGQIEDVGTLEAFRGQGLAKAVVLRALAEARAAGCDLVFLEAEADDWPKELYRRLGFDAIGRTYAFARRPASRP